MVASQTHASRPCRPIATSLHPWCEDQPREGVSAAGAALLPSRGCRKMNALPCLACGLHQGLWVADRLWVAEVTHLTCLAWSAAPGTWLAAMHGADS